MTHFHHLRTTPWEPTFTWVATAAEAADHINSFHEDYPQRVEVTQRMIELPHRLFPGESTTLETTSIHTGALLSIHWFIFNEASHRGQWRKIRVRVGPHVPPRPAELPALMDELQQAYLSKVRTVDDLKDWYFDFLTIHPFQDGNGRVAGVIVASFSHAKEPEKGWLGPNQ